MESTNRFGLSAGLPELPSLFEHSPWFYAFCREHLFRDHTDEIAKALIPREPPRGFRLLELGCGPGFYACRLARRFPELEVTGVDLSKRLVERARNRAASRGLPNCGFQRGDAQALAERHEAVDAIVLSRLFLIVPDKAAVLSEVFRILRPGGRCFIAEPNSTLKTRIPLTCMRLLFRLGNRPLDGCREPVQAEVMRPEDFRGLIHSQPWTEVAFTFEGSYQFAVCTKGRAHSETPLPLQSSEQGNA